MGNYLWGDFSVDDMDAWLNKRLEVRNKSIDLSPYPLVLCHGDLCRRNLILEGDGHSIALVDWGYAGLYPRFFEIASISWLMPCDRPYEKPLLEALEKAIELIDEERRLIESLQIARASNLRYAL